MFSVSSSSQDRTTLPRFHTRQIWWRSSGNLLCKISNPSAYASIRPYSMPLWIIFT